MGLIGVSLVFRTALFARVSPMLASNPLDDHVQSLEDRAPPFEDRAPPLDVRAPSLEDRAPPLEDRAPSLGEHDPSLGEHNPSLGEHDPSLGEHNPSLGEHDPPLDGHLQPSNPAFLCTGPRLPTSGTTLDGKCASALHAVRSLAPARTSVSRDPRRDGRPRHSTLGDGPTGGVLRQRGPLRPDVQKQLALMKTVFVDPPEPSALP